MRQKRKIVYFRESDSTLLWTCKHDWFKFHLIFRDICSWSCQQLLVLVDRLMMGRSCISVEPNVSPKGWHIKICWRKTKSFQRVFHTYLRSTIACSKKGEHCYAINHRKLSKLTRMVWLWTAKTWLATLSIWRLIRENQTLDSPG